MIYNSHYIIYYLDTLSHYYNTSQIMFNYIHNAHLTSNLSVHILIYVTFLLNLYIQYILLKHLFLIPTHIYMIYFPN